MEVAQVPSVESDDILNVVACSPTTAVVHSSLSHPQQWIGIEWALSSLPTQPSCDSF